MSSAARREASDSDLSADFEEILSENLDCPVDDIWRTANDFETLSDPDFSTTVSPPRHHYNSFPSVSDSPSLDEKTRRDVTSCYSPHSDHESGNPSALHLHGLIQLSGCVLSPPSISPSANPGFITLEHDIGSGSGECDYTVPLGGGSGENIAVGGGGTYAAGGCEASLGADASAQCWDGGQGRPSRRHRGEGGEGSDGRGSNGSDGGGGEVILREQGPSASLTLESVLDLEARLPLSAAAAAACVSPAELRRACRRLGVRRWRHRAHAAAAAAAASPAARTVAYAANLRRRYGGAAVAAAAAAAAADGLSAGGVEGGGGAGCGTPAGGDSDAWTSPREDCEWPAEDAAWPAEDARPGPGPAGGPTAGGGAGAAAAAARADAAEARSGAAAAATTTGLCWPP